MILPVTWSYADDITLYSKWDNTCDLWQQLELASDLESDLWDTMDWGRKWLIDFNARKAQLLSFDQSNNAGVIDLKIDGSVFWGKIIFQDAGVAFLC